MKKIIPLTIILLFVLYLISLFLPYKEVKISNINQNMLNERVFVSGKIASVYHAKGVTFVNLTQENNSIKVVFFKNINLKKGENADIKGVVQIYKNELEIIGNS